MAPVAKPQMVAGHTIETEFMTVVTADDPSRWLCRQAFSSSLADGK
jgi:hypothetical protein